MTISKEKSEYLHSSYYNINKTGSFRGPKPLFDLVKRENKFKISYDEIREWLKGQSNYTRWREPRKNFSRNPIEPQFVGDIFQFDLMSFTEQPEYVKKLGKTMKHAFIGYDSFSCFGFAVALSDRKSEDIIRVLKRIFKHYKPISCMADRAGEFISKKTKKFFDELGIQLYFSNSMIHCPGAERLIKVKFKNLL